ncbi:translocation and assembly module TamB [Andreprevotia lacus DSM 23236]|jgi:translocation and assembly module TamB|uniref:Translocation and assembly module TamB n=1 Tax=Andreprevotia lacus DSM 23236 TaxID=1121001 RepID=A0A1W1Y0I6_9NEIS|nr:translocation/assembly module TamB domain-containing protein [Andreprevotia lacus]SMC29258.1 translocation and assembly module TamB [Andreprevotia lacus DSM 23236]
MSDVPVSDIQAQPAKPRRRWRNALRWLVYGTLLLVAVLALAGYFGMRWLDGPTGRAWLIAKLNATGVVKVERIDGPIWRDVTVSGIEVDTPDLTARLDRVHLVWEPYSLLARDFSASLLDAGTLQLLLKPGPPQSKPTQAPDNLKLPLGIHIDDLRLARLKLVDSPVDLRDIRVHLSSNGRFHQLEVKQLLAPQGRLNARLQLEGKAPFKAAGDIAFSGKVEDYHVAASYTLLGNLRDLLLQGKVSGERVTGELDLRLDAFAPYSYNILKQARLRMSRLNPAVLLAGLPQGDLNIRLDLQPAGPDSAQGALEISNAKPAAITQNGLPFSLLEAGFTVRAGLLDLASLDARLLGDGTLRGKGRFKADQLDAQFTLGGVDLARVIPSQSRSQLAGTVKLSGPYQAPNIVADLSDALYKAQLKADLGWLNPARERRLQVRKLELAHGANSAKLAGEFGFDKQDFKAEGQFSHFNPADFLAVPAGDLNGRFKAAGALKPQWQAQLDYDLATSRYNGQPLAGAGKLKLADQRLSDADLWLRLGDNRIDAHGALGKDGDRLQLKLALDSLGQLGHGFAGRVRGDAQLAGTLAAPLVTVDVSADTLGTPFGVAVLHGRAQAQLYPDLNKPLKLDIALERASGFGADISQLHLAVDGTRAQHRINLNLDGRYADTPAAITLAAAGALAADQQWRGRIEKLEAKAPLVLRLLAPLEAEFGARAVHLAGAELGVGDSRVRVDKLDWQPGKLSTAGNFSKLVLAEWVKLANIRNLDTDLVLSGHWQLQQGATLDGDIELARSGGDGGWRNTTGQRQAFGLDKLNLNIQARQSRLTLAGALSSSRFGNVTLSGDTVIDAARWQIASGAALNVRAIGDLPDLGRLAPLLGSGVQMAGQVRFNLQRGGPFDQRASLSGTLDGTGLMIKDSETGINLNEGSVHMRLQPGQVVLDSVKFKGGQGTLAASGTLDIASEVPVAKASVTAQRLTLINKPDMLLVVSGNGEVGYGKDGISVTGQMRADQGDIQYRSEDVPRLSDDVVVAGREPATPSSLALAVLQFDVDLGNNFHFRGYGLEADLTGRLGLRARPSQPLAAVGQVKIAENSDSTYKAYGQKLDIERGVLNFSGQLDNPGLDILAMRRGLSVEAGVSVKGTASNPRVTLYSEPSVPDNEKLAWLLFGHGTDSMDKGDSAVLAQILSGILMGGDPSKGLGDEILGGLGIDEVGMATDKMADGTSTQVVSVGKRLTKTVRLSLEKSLNGLKDAIKLSWQFSKRWSLVTRLGTDESTLDATYTLRFD